MRRPFDDTGATEPTLAFALSSETLSLDDLDELIARCESSIPPPPAGETDLSFPPELDLDPTELIARAIRETLSETLLLSEQLGTS
jgi:hypothetical protein